MKKAKVVKEVEGSNKSTEASRREFNCVWFDFHSTLVYAHDTQNWLSHTLSKVEKTTKTQKQTYSEDFINEFGKFLINVWDHVRVIDPHHTRDLSKENHFNLFSRTCFELFNHPSKTEISSELVSALYDTLTDDWKAYPDSQSVLKKLKQHDYKVVLISNVGFDIRDVLRREGLLEYIDHVVLSCEVGSVKPGKEIFQHALRLSNCSNHECLMVGDNYEDDGGACRLDVRTIILPKNLRNKENISGLDLVLHMLRLL